MLLNLLLCKIKNDKFWNSNVSIWNPFNLETAVHTDQVCHLNTLLCYPSSLNINMCLILFLVTSIGLVSRDYLYLEWVMAQFGGQKNPPWATQFAPTAVSQPGHSGQSLDLNSLHCEYLTSDFLFCFVLSLVGFTNIYTSIHDPAHEPKQKTRDTCF